MTFPQLLPHSVLPQILSWSHTFLNWESLTKQEVSLLYTEAQAGEEGCSWCVRGWGVRSMVWAQLSEKGVWSMRMCMPTQGHTHPLLHVDVDTLPCRCSHYPAWVWNPKPSHPQTGMPCWAVSPWQSILYRYPLSRVWICGKKITFSPGWRLEQNWFSLHVNWIWILGALSICQNRWLECTNIGFMFLSDLITTPALLTFQSIAY